MLEFNEGGPMVADTVQDVAPEPDEMIVIPALIPVQPPVAAPVTAERKLTAAKAKRLANRLAAQRIRDSLFLAPGESSEVPWFNNLGEENRRMVLSALETVAGRLDDASI